MKKFLLPLFFAFALKIYASIPFSYEKIEDLSGLQILTPSLSERKSVKIRLPNGLEAYLISDPEIKESSAAVSVESGYWEDPSEYPGMAHFLEHMLFMGTKNYPQEHEFMEFVQEHGGKVNAYTASDRTVYMFSIPNNGFEGALNRFADFFVEPLFLTSCIDRELHAVDQEHAKNIENDEWRQHMIFKETGNPKHPNAKFSTGNADTLGGIPQNEMKKWYKDHYSANKMHLVMLSSQSLDELISKAIQEFSSVPVNPQKNVPVSSYMTSEKQRGHSIYIKPVKDLKMLSLCWELPTNLSEDIDTQTGKLLAYILNNGNKNSLFGLLKRKHLAESIQVTEEAFSKSNKCFIIDINLSDKGIENVHQVITHCFEALARIKKTGIPKYVFDEVQKIANIKYEYQSRSDAFEYALNTVGQLIYEDLATFPRKTLFPTKYDPELIGSHLECLTAENCVFFIIADPEKTHVKPTKREKWMAAEYAIQSFDSKQLSNWTHSPINPEIGLPHPNPYIPKNLTLNNSTFSSETIQPILLHEGDGGKVYFSEDSHYLSPEIAHFFRIKSPFLDGSPKSKVFLDLFVKGLEDDLFAIRSAAETAGSNILIKPDHSSLVFAMNGFSEPSSKIIEEIFHHMKKISPNREQFELYKQSLLSTYENGQKEMPVLQSLELLQSILFNDNPTNDAKYTALKNIKYEDFTAFAKNLFKKTYIEALFYGNLNQKEANLLWTNIRKKVKSDNFPLAEQKQRQIFLLPEKQGPFMLAHSTSMQGNAALLLIEQGPSSYKQWAGQQIINRVIKQSFFDTLRTKQQTGYIAKTWDREEERQLFQLFAVQSATHQPNELIARFELFIENFLRQFSTEFSQDRFEKVREMAITHIKMPPENLLLMGSRLFYLAFDYDGEFELIEKRKNALEKITYEQMHQIALETFSRKNTHRLAILLEGAGVKERDFRYELVSKEDLLNQGRFVAWK